MTSSEASINAQIATLQATLKTLKGLRETMVSAYRSFLEARFRAAGGCQECQGRGWRVVWDTMDSLSGCYAEYGPCTSPTCTASVTGPNPNPAHHSKYDSLRGPAAGGGDPVAYERLLGSSDRQIAGVESQITILRAEFAELRTFRKGDRVVVVKGRKVPVGTTGTVSWTNTSPRSGETPTRIGINTGKPDPKSPGKTIWEFTAVTNCQKVVDLS